jgi:hypothetical protein
MPVLSAALLDDPREDLAALCRILGGRAGRDRDPDHPGPVLAPGPARAKRCAVTLIGDTPPRKRVARAV